MGQLIWDIIYYWHSDEFGRLIRNIVVSVSLAAVMIVTGALYVGTYGWGVKAYYFAAVLVAISLYQIWLAYRRFLVGSEVGTVIEISIPGQTRAGQPHGQGLIETPTHGIGRYIQAAAALLASESTIGFIAAWLPAHLYRPAAAIMIPAGMTVAFWAIWQGGILWWPRINIAMAIGTLIGAALLILVQAAMGATAGFTFSALTPAQLQWLLLGGAVVIVVAFILSRVFKERAPWLRTLAWGLVFIGMVLTAVLGWSGALRGIIDARAYALRPLIGVVPPPSPQQYQSPDRKLGRFAPRAIPATTVTPGADAWEVSIDGTNDYKGPDLPAPGHQTGVMVPVGGAVEVYYKSGNLTPNWYGDKFPICGVSQNGNVFPGEKVQFPSPAGLYGFMVMIEAQGKWDAVAFPCHLDTVRLRNLFDKEAEVRLFFNSKEKYRNRQGLLADGFPYAGWDGERAVFTVRLIKKGGNS